jgi:VWFA-related protein
MGLSGRGLVAVVLLVLVFWGNGLSQDQQATFTSRSELVLVPAVVTDKSGAHVSGLTKDDFVVLEDGRPQKISVFEEIKTTAEPIKKIPNPAGQFGNTLEPNSGSRRLLIVALDLVNTPGLLQANAKSEVLKFLSKSLDPNSPTEFVLITRGGLHVIHDFTGYPRVLSAMLQQLTGTRNDLAEKEALSPVPRSTDAISGALARLARDENESKMQLESFERHSAILTTMEALQQIAGQVAGVPGRKALIWVSAGFPLSITKLTDSLAEPSPALFTENSVNDLYRRTCQLLNQAQLAVYPVDVRYLTNPGFQGADEPGVYFSAPGNPRDNPYTMVMDHRGWENEETLSTFRTFAENTGGRAYYNSNDIQRGLREAADDSASYYMLGYQLNRQGKKLGWHKMKVVVQRHGVEVRARNTFVLTDPQRSAAEDERAALRSALQSPVDFTAIAIQGTWTGTSAAAAKHRKIGFELVMPSGFADVDSGRSNHMHVEFLVKAASNGKKDPVISTRTVDVHLDAKGLEQVQQHGLTFRSALDLPAGDYNVRFVVLDALSGRIGSASAPLKVE